MLLVFANSMDYKNAQQKLSELRDSLDKVLGGKSEGPSREDAEKALKAAREGSKRAKKTLLGKIKDLPVVDKITQLGTAGTVAVSTAAITQTNIAVDETEVFVASVANDVVHQRLMFPPLITDFVDFSALNSWGTEVMKQKVAEVKAQVEKVESKVTETGSQATEEAKGQEPQAQEESADNGNKNGGDAEEVEQSTEEVGSEEVSNEEAEESAPQEIAEDVPEESADEIDEVKPHSDVESDESEIISNMPEPVITPDDGIEVSPSTSIQV